jgi:hypothetical protein
MDATRTDELWPRVAARIGSARGWSLRPLAPLGRPRAARRTWLAEAAGADGSRLVVVKASANPFAASRAAWVASVLSLLGERGCPVPTLLWQGPLDGHWFLTVQERLPGQPVGALDRPTLEMLLALVELQAEQAPRLGEGGWDLSWWIGGSCSRAERAGGTAPRRRRRLVAGEEMLALGGGGRLVRRIVGIAGNQGYGWSSPTARSPPGPGRPAQRAGRPRHLAPHHRHAPRQAAVTGPAPPPQ